MNVDEMEKRLRDEATTLSESEPLSKLMLDEQVLNRKDFADIFNIFDSLEGRRKFIVTTEKDMVRILNNPYYPPTMRDVIYYIPIRVGILETDGHEFIPNLLKKIEDPT